MATGRVPTTANSPLTAKGDLFGYSTAPARLAVGNDGEQIVADSSTSTGLRYQGNFAAGKNKIINGDCNINQRNFSSGTTSGQYIVDRFQDDGAGGTRTSSVQQFTPGSAPVAGYEAKQFMRTVTSGQSAASDYQSFSQAIENVRTFAGQTVTVSFWAKATTGTPNIGITLDQNFGSGGSASTQTSSAVQTITTSWARYSFTITVPSISGKTIGGDNNRLKLYIFVSAGATISGLGYPAVGVQNNTFDIWGVQVEAGSVATAFQTATGTIQGELAACQRYYYNMIQPFIPITATSAGTSIQGVVSFPVTMRISPTAGTNMTNANYDSAGPAAGKWCFNVPGTSNSTKTGTATIAQYTSSTGSSFVSTGATYSPVPIGINVSNTSYLDFNAEL